MAHKYEEQLQAINDSLQSTQELLASFNIPDLNAIKGRISANVKKEQFFLNSLLGKNAVPATQGAVEIKPLTHVFGKPLKVNADKPVKPTDTAPSKTEKEKFIAEVNDLYSNFLTLDDEALFNKPNALIMRGVGKMAGYPDAETAEINLEYINAIRAAIISKNEEQDVITDAKNKTKTDAKK